MIDLLSWHMENRQGDGMTTRNKSVKKRMDMAPTKANCTGEIDAYLADHAQPVHERKAHYAELVNNYYNLVTEFYERGWGQSFHFAPRWKNESLAESIKRYEYWLAHQLRLNAGRCVLDVGCGIGGPMRSIARFVDCHVTGINNHEFQVQRAVALNAAARLQEQCAVRHGDFMQMPFESNSFDAVYAIEATVHAPDLTGAYREIHRVLKPGALFATLEWCMTCQFKADQTAHQRIKRDIEIGNGIPSMGQVSDVLWAMKQAGFEVMRTQDIMVSSEIPWWEPLHPSTFSLSTWRTSLAVANVAHVAMRAFEFAHLLPRGASSVGRMLAQGGAALVAGGKAGIFTPGFFVLARKPLAGQMCGRHGTV